MLSRVDANIKRVEKAQSLPQVISPIKHKRLACYCLDAAKRQTSITPANFICLINGKDFGSLAVKFYSQVGLIE